MHVARFARIMIIALLGLWLACASPAFAGVYPPHVTTDTVDTDVCAMCHRSHTSASDTGYRRADVEATSNALTVGKFLDGSDRGLCLVCHGTTGSGADTDVETALESRSAHSLAPTSSAFGPSPKNCSDCHDSHGTVRAPGGGLYAALLRSKNASGVAVYSGEAYCGTCHDRHLTKGYSGVGLFMKTAHGSKLPVPSVGTGIRCSVCHDGHGSEVAPLIRGSLYPPAVAATVAVTANDRTLCYKCHAAASATYGGQASYELAGHALSSKSVTLTAEWASHNETRTVGECQNCHAPMGASDGAGGVIPKMAAVAGRALCERCHAAAGPAGTNIASLSYPATASPDPELVGVYAPQVRDASAGRAELYSRETSGPPPRPLDGPRAFASAQQMGMAASGDIDGDGTDDLVVASRSSNSVDVWTDDGLGSLTNGSGPGHLMLEAPADLIAVGEVNPNGGAAEIVAVTKATGAARVYRLSGGTLERIAGPFAVGNDPSSIAIGDVIGSPLPDVVVTSLTDDTFTVLEGGESDLTAMAAQPTGDGPTGVSIGDVWPGGTKKELVILNSLQSSGQVSIFNGDGTGRHDYDTAGPGASVPSASAIGDVLPGISSTGTSGKEIVVAMDGGAGQGGFEVFAQVQGGGLAAPEVHTTTAGYRPGSVAIADVDGDGRAEPVIGNGGRWVAAGGGIAPSMQVWRAGSGGVDLQAAPSSTLWGGGTELAGSAPSIIAADLGDIGPSRHDVPASTSSHVSTETTGFKRHVTCSDCHEVHQATAAAAAAPDVYGPIKGTWGVSVSNASTTSVSVSQKQGVQYEYQVCFKCHTGWIDLQGDRDLSFEFNDKNASVHAIEKAAASSEANAASFEAGWSNASVLYCRDCHGSAETSQPKGPHASTQAPLLRKPYYGDPPSDPNGLCYACHKYTVYYDGTSDAAGVGSLFGSAAAPQLHKAHVLTRGLSCASCHVSHGSTDLPHLLRPGIGFADTGNGATCTNGCHGGAAKMYTRP